MSHPEAETRGIKVQVESQLLPERSNPKEGRWFFVYTVRIANEGKTTAQLVSRHWIITDAHGHVEEVEGPGVVGEQPVLGPGEAFEYTSACPLGTASGTMHGTYQMVTEAGEKFDATIPAFFLGTPETVN